MSRKDDILAKASRCIDEVYPMPNDINAPFLPTEQFLDEAAEWVIRAVPVRALGAGISVSLPEDDTEALTINEDGSGRVKLQDDFKRLLYFKASDWVRPVITPIYDTDIAYSQQFNPFLRGTIFRPVVAICKGETEIEFFSLRPHNTEATVEYRYFGYSWDEDNYPKELVDATAWKVAELVLISIQSLTAAQACAAKVTDIIQLL